MGLYECRLDVSIAKGSLGKKFTLDAFALNRYRTSLPHHNQNGHLAELALDYQTFQRHR